MKANSTKKPSKFKCDICKIAVQHANQLAEHLSGRRHRKQLLESHKQEDINQQGVNIKTEPINILETNESNGESRKRKFEEIEELPEILLSVPKDRSNTEVSQYFSQFGSIKKIDIDSINSNLCIQYESKDDANKVMGKEHFIKGQKLIITWLNQNEGIESNINTEGILNHIKDHITLDLQIRSFVEYATWNVSLYLNVKHDMEEELREVFPSCIVWPFGSFATSLQFKSSKMDIFLSNTNDEHCLKTTKTVLTNGTKFKNVNFCSGDLPGVGCKHVDTGINCLINTRSLMAAKNSELIKYYIDLDVKVRSFILVVKFWAKNHEILKRSRCFSNNALVLMCIFYLQQKHSFPSVQQLQSKTIPTDCSTIWNLNISKEPMYNNKYQLDTTLKMLLQGFFTFYADFKYNKIISPYLGEDIDRTSFRTQHTVPEAFKIYKEKFFVIEPLKCHTPIIVQDPFVHNANLITPIFKSDLLKFVKRCRVAQWRLSHNDERNMLHALFTATSKEFLSFSHSVCIKGNVDASADNFRKYDWFQRVKHFLSIVFEKIFKFDMTEMVNERKERFAKYRATSFVDVWTDRDKYGSSIEDQLDRCRTILGKEILVTECICNNSTVKTANSVLFESYIMIQHNDHIMDVKVIFERMFNDKSFFLFFELFNTKLCSWFEKYERELDAVF